MTPREFRALQDRWEAQRDYENGNWGLIATLLYNPHRGKKRAAKPSDFYPSLKDAERPQQTTKQMLGTFTAFALLHNAKVEALEEKSRG